MAYSAEQWERAKAYFEAGTHNPQQISDLVGIERSTIVKKAKNHSWIIGANSDYIEAKTIIAVKKSQLNSQTLQVLDDIADEKIRNKKLVYSVTTIALEKLKAIAEKGTKEISVSKYVEGKSITEKETVNLSPSEYATIIDATDKASLTLGVNQRHAKQGDTNITTSAQAVTNSINVEFAD